MLLAIEKGWGYWDVSVYPRGGDFKRAGENLRVAEVLGTWKDESRVRLIDGRNAMVKTCALIEVTAEKF